LAAPGAGELLVEVEGVERLAVVTGAGLNAPLRFDDLTRAA
jgi:hypothetical protein